MNKILALLASLFSGLVYSGGNFDDNLISRCSLVTEVFARVVNDISMKESATQDYRDAMTEMAAHYKTMNYFSIYSGEGFGDERQTEEIIDRNKKILGDEISKDYITLSDGVSICAGNFKRLSDASKLKMDKWFGDGFYDTATELDKKTPD